MSAVPLPPAHVEPFVRILGVDLATRFLLRFGGATLYLAPTPQGRSMAADLISDDQARALAAEDLPRRVPTAKPWIAATMKAQGLSHAEIARRLHTSDVTVRKYIRAHADTGGEGRVPGSDPRQARLF